MLASLVREGVFRLLIRGELCGGSRRYSRAGDAYKKGLGAR